MELLLERPGRPSDEEIRKALRNWAFVLPGPRDREVPDNVLPPAVAASPLASRPYDLRHSALSTWLNAGVDPTEVAERAGNSVEVLLTRYAKCLDGRQDVANRRIEDLLREYE